MAFSFPHHFNQLYIHFSNYPKLRISLNTFSHLCFYSFVIIMFMKNLVVFFICISSSGFLLCQSSYWQQEVNYKIDVKLDDIKHELTAVEEFEYTNNSPEKLDFLYIHLWPNAYQNEKSALGKQLWENGNQILRFGADSVKGSINGLDFKVNGEKVEWIIDTKNNDICKLLLKTPLFPGEKLKVTTPFNVKIPTGEISRLGHIDQSYQITQWYPKPAVYDKNGWNAFPYLNQGEFYSEFGSFDVTITLPKNYVVGATGDLQTESEILFMNEMAELTKKKFSNGMLSGEIKNSEFPISSSENKTIRYTQNKVHDFAWFADKRYEVLKGEVELPQSKRKVTSWALFTPKNAFVWKDAIEYINDGTYYYSLWNGDYPYNHVTAVDGTISAGGGMEYPNVTVIGNTSTKEDLEVVIVHEVGHNWFYGILGSNERVHGWMDEGLNTLNEVRYMQTKYPNNTRMSDQILNGNLHFDNLSHHDMNDVTFRTTAILGEDQPIETHSADFSSINYGTVMYIKTGLVMFYLRNYLGEEEFGKCTHAYFENWKFKHPQPEDLRADFEKTSGKDLSWLFDDLIKTTNHIDYKIVKVRKLEDGTDVVVKNVGQVNGPINVSAYESGVLVETKWAEPGNDKRTVHFTSSKIDEVRIDPINNIPELSRSNNNWNKEFLFHKIEPLKFEFLFGDQTTTKTNVFWTPMLTGNFYDKAMLGVVLHNYGVAFKRTQYLVAPFYSFGRKNISGIAELSYSFLPKNTFKLTRVGASIKSFKDGVEERSEFVNISPYLFMKLGNRKNTSPFTHNLLIQSSYTNRMRNSITSEEIGGFVKYAFDYSKANYVLKGNVRNDYMQGVSNSNQLGRFSIEGTYKYRYLKNKMNRWIELRLFFGKNYLMKINSIYDKERFSYSLSGATGTQDIYYEDYFFGRNNTYGIWGQQRVENMGGFKSTNWYGTTSQWLTSANLFIQLPIKVNGLGVFADAGAISQNGLVYGAFNSGLGFRISDVFGVYFPLYQSLNMGNLFTDYKSNIRFSLKLNLVNKGLKLKMNL